MKIILLYQPFLHRTLLVRISRDTIKVHFSTPRLLTKFCLSCLWPASNMFLRLLFDETKLQRLWVIFDLNRTLHSDRRYRLRYWRLKTVQLHPYLRSQPGILISQQFRRYRISWWLIYPTGKLKKTFNSYALY